MTMPHVASTVPDESDLLCEGCGYMLNGLLISGNCPECGKPISQSTGEHRQLSAFEYHPCLRTFISTSAAAILHPRLFFQSLTTRLDTKLAERFALLHVTLAGFLFSIAVCAHFLWITETALVIADSRQLRWALAIVFAAGFPLITLSILALTELASWLSAVEARYWGMRLPRAIVRRGLRFHSAHYLPVAVLAALMTWGYRLLVGPSWPNRQMDTAYLYTLCGLVIVSAIYLFQMYWIAMKSMMYANR